MDREETLHPQNPPPVDTSRFRMDVAFRGVAPGSQFNTTVTTKTTNISTHDTKDFKIHIFRFQGRRRPVQIHPASAEEAGGDDRLFSGASRDFTRDLFFHLPPSFSFSMSLSFSLLGDGLHEATAAGLVLLRLDVVVELELGFVGLLRRSVLQLPDGRENKREKQKPGS